MGPRPWNFAASLLICCLLLVVVYGSSPKILSVTRSSEKGDSFELDLTPYGCPSCEQYGAVSVQSNGGTSSGCLCRCGDEKPTFYSTQTGQHGCVKDGDVLADAQGDFDIPTTIPLMDEPISSMSSPTKKNNNVQKSTEALVETTDSNPVSTGGYSKASDKDIWIAVSLALAGLVLIIIIVITVFLWLKCRRNCKQKRTESCTHHPAAQPAISTVCSTLHDYEYVHYPCLVEGARTPPVIPRGNPLYERSADNKLIIWTPGHSGTLTRPNSRSSEATAPRLPYQRLLTRTSSSSPDCSATAGPFSPLGLEEGFPYQKLVRTLPSLRRSDQECGHVEKSAAAAASSTGAEEGYPYQKLFKSVPSLQREEQAYGHTEESTKGMDRNGACPEAYQSLSLQRNQLYPLKECDDYAKVDSASRPESSEYDYARVSTELDPVELNKFFRISHGSEAAEEMPRSSMAISIGDLDNTTSNTIINQRRRSAISKTSSTSSCSGDYENCTCKNTAKRNGLSNADRDDDCEKPKDLRPADCYEDLSGGCRLDPEDYVEMGKRKSMMVSEESRDLTETEDSGHEYFVLEGLVEACEDETAVDES